MAVLDLDLAVPFADDAFAVVLHRGMTSVTPLRRWCPSASCSLPVATAQFRRPVADPQISKSVYSLSGTGRAGKPQVGQRLDYIETFDQRGRTLCPNLPYLR
jgi:hypothetical protein